MQNPIANLISVPIKLDWDTGIGPEDADKSTYIIQPVIPFGITEELNVISRTIVPVYVDAESPVRGGKNVDGMGDILQSFFVSPKAPTASGWVWGAGPALSLPTGDDGLTTDKFSVGPTAVALKQTGGWTYGALWNHLWSVSFVIAMPGTSTVHLRNRSCPIPRRCIPVMPLTPNQVTDWEGEEWTVPINLTISQLLRVGGQPVSLLAGYRYYADAPSGGPDWGLRFQVTLIFPK